MTAALTGFATKSLNANSYANKIVNPTRPRSPFRVHQFGASMGGPGPDGDLGPGATRSP